MNLEHLGVRHRACFAHLLDGVGEGGRRRFDAHDQQRDHTRCQKKTGGSREVFHGLGPGEKGESSRGGLPEFVERLAYGGRHFGRRTGGNRLGPHRGDGPIEKVVGRFVFVGRLLVHVSCLQEPLAVCAIQHELFAIT